MFMLSRALHIFAMASNAYVTKSYTCMLVKSQIGHGASACLSGGIITPYTSLACGSSGKFLAYSEQQDWDNHW